MKLRHIFLILSALFIFSCSVEKRNYRKGYHIDWAFKNKSKHNSESIVKSKNAVKKIENLPANVEAGLNESKINDEELAEATLTKGIASKKLNTNRVILKDEPCGDVLVFRNDEILKVKVIEITEEFIKYKRCDNLDGPLITVSKNKVRSVTYSNGVKEYFDNSSQRVTESKSQNQSKPKETPSGAIIALALSILGIIFIPIIPSIIALFLASDAEKKILSAPDKYDGLDLTKIARIISIIGLVLWICFFLFFILLVIALM